MDGRVEMAASQPSDTELVDLAELVELQAELAELAQLTTEQDISDTNHPNNTMDINDRGVCRHCGLLMLKVKLDAHERTCGGLAASTSSTSTTQLICEPCDLKFSHKTNLKRHQKSCQGQNTSKCNKCQKIFSRLDNLKRHQKSCEGPNSTTCCQCGQNFDTIHQMLCHEDTCKNKSRGQKRTQPQEPPIKRQKREDEDPRVIPSEVRAQLVHDGTEAIYLKNWTAIRSYNHIHRVQSVYNIRLTSSSIHDILLTLNEIFNNQRNSFKINASFGFILQHRISGEVRYFHSSANNARILPEPISVENHDHFRDFIDQLEGGDFLEFARQMRPDSSWIVLQVTNISLYLNHLNFLIQDTAAPIHIKNRKGVIAVSSENNMCFFHALALHKNPQILENYQKCSRLRTKRAASELYSEYTPTPVSEFKGVELNEIEKLEIHFNIGIRIYCLEKINDEYVAVLFRRPTPTFADVMTLDLSETTCNKKHFSYISDLKKYAQSFKCLSCGQKWRLQRDCNRHETNCNRVTKEIFPAGAYTPDPTIFNKLCDLDIEVPEELQFYPFRTCYDFEAYFKDGGAKFVAVHIPMSFSVCSNIPGYEHADFYTDSDPDVLIEKFLNILNIHSDAAYQILYSKYKPYLKKLDDLSKEVREKEAQMNGEASEKNNYYDDLSNELRSWLQVLPVLGFNSGKYDVNMICDPLMNLLKHTTTVDENKTTVNRAQMIIKKNNSFMAIRTQKLQFLDITNYLSAGSSYSGFLKAFQIEEKKGYFPYEYVKAYDQLSETSLPPYEAFYSNLNLCNSLDSDKCEETGRENHSKLQEVWCENNMTCLVDFLKWYNNLDVTGFILAVDKQFEFFKEHLELDMFKQALSLPGLSLRYAFQTTDAKFKLFGNQDAYIHKLLRKNIVGGPSLVFHRYHEVDVTKIKAKEFGDSAKPVQSILGLDANALYLWAFAEKMPTGDYIVRNGPDFKREKQPVKQHSRAGIAWLDKVAWERNIKILHAENGQEIRIGSKKYKVDGFCPETQEIFEYHGCFWHGCENCTASKQDDEHPYKPGQTFKQVRESTREKVTYFENLGYSVVERWECENPDKFRTVKSILGSSPNEKDILDSIKKGELFGFVECDIRTPEHLKKQFAQLPPIFKNTEVSRDDIGNFMRDYCEKFNVLKHPSKLLISSYFAEKIVLITPLLKYYLELGLEVTHIHLVVEYESPESCFSEFATKVSDARRLGDQSEDNDIVAQCFKLVGNSAYGKSIQDISKQSNIHYVDGILAGRLINKKLFKKCTKINDSLFQVELKKAVQVHSLPIHLGFFVYGYAKLKMLQFQYNFMQKFLPYDSYELVEMDTDSSYFALSVENIEDAVKPELRREFYEHYHEWFPTESCNQHHQNFVDVKLRQEPWFQQQCCKDAFKYQKRTPGLFKTEFKGLGIAALCSKTYICWGKDETKLSCKGLQKKTKSSQSNS